MTTVRGIIATALLLSIHMVLECSGKKENPPTHKFNAKYREIESNAANQPAETTTIFPVNPYVFSAEDYDILQDAGSLQQAMSIVTYEPQKIDAKKVERYTSKHNDILEKTTQSLRASPTTTTSITTQLPLEKKYYEVPRKQSRTRAAPQHNAKLERGYPATDSVAAASKLAAEASSPRRAYEVAPENSSHQSVGSSAAPAPLARSFTISNQQQEVDSPSPPLPLYPPLTERTTLSANFAKATDNYHIASRSRDNKTEQKGSETARIATTAAPVVNKKRRKVQRTQQQHHHQQLQQQQQHSSQEPVDDHQQQASFLVTSDRIPRPFSLPTVSNPTAQASTYSARTSATRQSIAGPQSPTTSIEQVLVYPTASARQSIPRPIVAIEQHAYASTPVRQNARTTVPTRQDQANAYFPVPAKQEPTYQTVPLRRNAARQTGPTEQDQEQLSTFQTIPSRRNTVRHTVPLEQTEVARATVPTKQEQQQPIVYTIPRRPERTNAATTIPSRQEQAFARSAVPARHEQAAVARSTVPTRQEQALAYSTAPTKQDHALTYSASPVRQEPTYQTIPLRRSGNAARQNKPSQRVETHSSVPVERLPTRRKPIRQNYQYEQADVPPPTVTAEQNVGNPTIAQPTYVPTRPQRVKQRGGTKFDSANQENKDYKEYVDNTNYNDYNENPNDNNHSSNENTNNDKDNNNNDDDKHQYSYSYNERYVEPLDEAPRQRSHAYKVEEDVADYPDRAPQYAQDSRVLQRGAYKQVEPDYDQNQAQYIDLRPTPTRDSDYDQAQGQNVQQVEVAEVRKEDEEGQQKLRGEEGDLMHEADHHHKKHHKPKKEHHEAEEGGSEEHHEGDHHEHGEHGEKGYKEHHEHDEGEKGHHDKEGHDHHYDEKEGKDKEEHEEAGFHKEHEKGEEGEKKAAFNEKGDHKKGHSTKGEHVIHKKDEFEKKTEFFDEFHEGGDSDKDGGYHEEHHHKKGGHHKKGHHHKGQHEHEHGEKGHHDKGHHHHEKKGHHEDEGHEHHHDHREKHGKKAGHEDAKKWHHKKGDRRR